MAILFSKRQQQQQQQQQKYFLIQNSRSPEYNHGEDFYSNMAKLFEIEYLQK